MMPPNGSGSLAGVVAQAFQPVSWHGLESQSGGTGFPACESGGTMYGGDLLNDISDRKLALTAQLGIEHIAVNNHKGTDIANEDGTWNVRGIKDVQARLARF